MSAIGPGDFVECVDASPRAHYPPPPLTVGAVYVVARLSAVPAGWRNEGEVTLYLEGVHHPRPETFFGFNPDRFRPIYRPKQSLITDLLTKAPSELEPA